MNKSLAYLLSLAVFVTAAASAYASLDDLLSFIPTEEVEASTENQEKAEPVNSHVQSVQSLSPSSVVVTESALVKELSDLLVDHYGLSGDLRLTPLQGWTDLAVPGDGWKAEITAFPSGGLESRFMLRFRIHSMGRVVGEWSWMLRAELWREAFITRKQINARTPLSFSDFSLRKVDTLRLRDTVLPTDTNLKGYSAKSTVAANKPLFWEDVSARDIVTRGDTVKVLVERGPLIISMNARALESGAMGEIVTLRNLRSNKRIQGEVTDENTVRIYY